MSRILTLVVLLPLAVLLVIFCVLNRAPVILSMDLFGTTPQFTLVAPLFVVVLTALLLGVLLGGIGTFATQTHHRSKASRRQSEIDNLRREVAASNERLRALREERERAAAAPSASLPATSPSLAPASAKSSALGAPRGPAQGALPAPRAA